MMIQSHVSGRGTYCNALLVLALTASRGVESFSPASSSSATRTAFLVAPQQQRTTLLSGLPTTNYNNKPRSSIVPTLLWAANNDDDNTAAAVADVPRPDPSILLSAQDDTKQKGGVAAIGLGILLGTYLMVGILDGLDGLLGGFLETFLGFTVPLPLGLLYAALGATHFAFKDDYAAIVPPPGTWGGLWQVPAPGADDLGVSYEDYHVYWTGVAEIGGGILLVLGALNAVPIQLPAFLLFCLTLAVTPANVYMFTHDAQLGAAPPFPYPEGHIFRGALQCVLLSLFWFFAFH